MADRVPSLAERAAQLIADFEHASFNNAPISPVMLAQMKALVADALAEKACADAAQEKTGSSLGAAAQEAQHALSMAKEIQAEAGGLADVLGHIATL